MKTKVSGIFTALTVVAASALGWVAPASSKTTVVDLRKDADVEITGADTVAPAGDVNGDGTPDFVVAIGDPTRGRTFVVFGRSDLDDLDLTRLGDGGFVIEGAEEDDFAWHSAGAGDVNGDGLDDIVVGATQASTPTRSLAGITYVVFGKDTSDTVHLRDFDLGIQGGAGFRIDGPRTFALSGDHVDGAGDVNHDGLADVIVLAPFADSTYVVFGKTGPLPVDLADFDDGTQGDAGYVIWIPGSDSSAGMAAAGAGDVNGDGTPDVIIGVRPTTYNTTGSAYVVFGKTGPEPIDVRDDLEGEGFRIKGAEKGSETGQAVDGAGDIDGDGLGDVIVGAPHVAPYRGNVYVVFGKKGSKTIKLGHLDDRGYKIKGEMTNEYNGEKAGDNTGYSVAGAGDMDGDGRPDVLVGAPNADHHHRDRSGSVFVVYGKRSTATIKLKDMGRHGYRIDGPGDPAPTLGGTVASPGDINGDGAPDVLAGTLATSHAYLQWGL